MPKVELQINDETLQRAQRSAQASHVTVEQWLAEAIERTTSVPPPDALLGLFASEPDVVDAVVEDAWTARETHSLRAVHE